MERPQFTPNDNAAASAPNHSPHETAPRGPAHRDTPSAVFTFGRALLRPLLRLCYRPIISGTSNVPQTGPVLIVSNHLAAADTILIPSFAPRKVRFLAKASLFNGTLNGWFFRQIGAVPVYREAGSAAQNALAVGEEILATGQVFAVFPEGSRSRDGRLYRGRNGAAHLALQTGATVIPVGLIGTQRSTRTPGTRTQIVFGPAIPLADLNGFAAATARREATARIMSAIQALTAQTIADSYSSGGRGA